MIFDDHNPTDYESQLWEMIRSAGVVRAASGWGSMMWDMLDHALAWLLFAFFAIQLMAFLALLMWTVWTDAIAPRLIATSQIGGIAAELGKNHADPGLEAFARRQRAWFDGDGAQMTYWNRVGKAIGKLPATPQHNSGMRVWTT